MSEKKAPEQVAATQDILRLEAKCAELEQTLATEKYEHLQSINQRDGLYVQLEAFKAKVLGGERMWKHKIQHYDPFISQIPPHPYPAGDSVEVFAVPCSEVEDHIVDVNKKVEQQKDKNQPAIALLNEWAKEPGCSDPDCKVCKMLERKPIQDLSHNLVINDGMDEPEVQAQGGSRRTIKDLSHTIEFDDGMDE